MRCRIYDIVDRLAASHTYIENPAVFLMKLKIKRTHIIYSVYFNIWDNVQNCKKENILYILPICYVVLYMFVTIEN